MALVRRQRRGEIHPHLLDLSDKGKSDPLESQVNGPREPSRLERIQAKLRAKFDKSSGANQCYLGGQKFWSSTGGMVAASELKQFDFVRAANGELIRAMSIDVHPDSLIILGRWWTMLQV